MTSSVKWQYYTEDVGDNMSKFIRHPFLNMISMYHSEILCRKLSEINLKVYQTKINQGKMLEIDLRKYGLDNVFSRPTLLINHWTIRDMILMICIRPKFNNRSYIKTEISDSDLLVLIGHFLSYENEVSGEKVENFSSNEMHYMLYGLALQQFPSQVSNAYKNSLRNHIIFSKINSELNYLIDTVSPFQEKLKMSYDDYMTILLILFAKMQREIYVKERMESTFEHWEEKIENFEHKYNSVVNYHSAIHTELEGKSLHHSRYLYPIIHDSDKVYTIDPFMLERKLYEGAYWVIRDYFYINYPDKDRDYFPNKFGVLFEKYVEFLFEKVRQINEHFTFIKLSEDNKNMFFDKKGSDNRYVDFIVELGEYQLVIECKSAIQMIDASNLYDNYKAVTCFFERNIYEACQQLYKTNEKLIDTKKKRVNLILIYQEAYQKNHTKDIYFHENEFDDYAGYLIVDIVEMENLLGLICKDENLAVSVIEAFVDMNYKSDTSQGQDLEYKLNKIGKKKVSILDYFEDELRKTIHQQ